MGQIISVVSGKGGTGKTSFCAGVAVALCALGEKVLLIDADRGLRSLDIVLGMSDRVLFSWGDVLDGACSIKEAAVKHPIVKNLRLLTAPSISESDNYRREEIAALLERARPHFTWILIDCAAGFGHEVMDFALSSDRSIVVSTPDHSALRGAQRIGIQMAAGGVEQIHIAVNRLRLGMIGKGEAVNIDAAMDTSGLPLLGAIPEDKDVIACGNQGQVLVLFSTGYARVAYANIARRLRGTRLPLLQGVKLKK
ncbi:MAG: AAA family ATPase [Clostridia bacterium]|nr:AAA family ATPase [Clostridia bacterium]MBR5283560.1 AAA family ATPase [Clostridia bacterium]